MAVAQKPKGCSGCPAETYGIGFIPPEGPSDANLILIGQGPGESEAFYNRPFYGLAPSGARLNEWLSQSRIVRGEILVGNIVQCWLPKFKRQGKIGVGNREPTRAEMDFCWNAHVGPWLVAHYGGTTDKVIVPVGVPASRFLLKIPPDRGVVKYMGTLNWVDLPEIKQTHARS